MNKNTTEISFLVPAKNASSFLEKTLNSVHEFLENNFKNTFEIILILNGDNESELQAMLAIADRFKEKCHAFKICYSKIKGKGAALREGFLISSGKNIFFTDADLPYDLSFFLEANHLLSHGYHFISGNRRFGNSVFTLPVTVLRLAYRRHRIGLMFNKVARFLFNIDTSDTQAGIKAFSRRLGEKVYSLETCPGFLFDLEFFLVAKQNGFKHNELSVHLYLNSEKSTVKLVKESLETAYWLSKISYQNKRKYYRFKSEMNFTDDYFITADDWGLSPSINRGILTLVKMGVVTRVSILADGLYVNDYLDELKTISNVELGVHFNLTYDNNFKSPVDLLSNMLSPFRKKEKENLVYQELERQFKLIKDLNLDISYADGHHHCHIFPGVVDTFSRFLREQNIRESRLPHSWKFIFSGKILLLILSMKAKKKFNEMGITYRPFHYPNYRKIHSTEELRHSLVHKVGYEVITHPSDLADLELLSINDSYNHERVKEFNLFKELSPSSPSVL